MGREKGRKYESIQFLRGFAILVIICSHLNPSKKLDFEGWGAAGVSMFLFISGMLDGLRLNGSGTSGSLFGYLKNKILKFIPLHFIMLLLALPLEYGQFAARPLKYMGLFVIDTLCLQAWVPSEDVFFSLNGVSWYLGLVMFNAVLFWAIHKYSPTKRVGIKIILLAVSILAWNLIWMGNRELSNLSFWCLYIFPVARALEYLLGLYVSYGLYNIPENRLRLILNKYGKIALILMWILEACALALNLYYIDSPVTLVIIWILPTLCIVSLSLFAEMLQTDNVKGFFYGMRRVIVFVGNISMELFLTHQIAIRYANRVVDHFGLSEIEPIRILVCVAGIAIMEYIALRWTFLKGKKAH